MHASNVVNQARNLDPSFPGTREGKFLSTLTDAFSQSDVEVRTFNQCPLSIIASSHPRSRVLQGFTNALVEWDQISKLDNWKTGVLLAAKQKLQADDDDSYR